MFFFPDTTALCNFAAIDRLELLREYVGDSGRWVQAVEDEVRNSSRTHDVLGSIWVDGWLGAPIKLNRKGELERVQRFRRLQMFGDQGKPLQHLGESETFVAIKDRVELAGSMVITDDHDAHRLLAHYGVATRDTLDVLQGLVAVGSISAAEGLRLSGEMAEVDRSLRRTATREADLIV
jgi:predicted nucleic acid-binding protein